MFQYGVTGSGSGQFNAPYGIVFDNAGVLYVADSGNNRIVRVDTANGNAFTSFGTVGNGNDNFRGPRDVWLDGTSLLVADTQNNRVKIHTAATGAFVRQFTNHNDVSCVRGGAGGDYFLAVPGDNRVRRINGTTGTTVYSSSGGVPSFSANSYLHFDTARDVLFVTDFNNNRVVILAAATGTNVGSFGSAGSACGQMRLPYGIVGDSSQVALVEAGNLRIDVYSGCALNFANPQNLTQCIRAALVVPAFVALLLLAFVAL